MVSLQFLRSAIHQAAWRGDLARVRAELQAGANVEADDGDGNTPLMCASGRGYLEVVKYLVEEAGANVEVKRNDGKTALDLARKCNKTTVVQYLEQFPRRRQRGQQEEDALICPVFLSHTGADEKAATFAAVLESKLDDKYEIEAFLDSETLKVGDLWRQKIEMNAKGCKVFVAILSPHYFLRFWCLYELDLALRHNCRIVPVVYDASLEAPKPTDATFVGKLREILSGKDLEEDPDCVLNRWLANIKTLDGIQACFNRAAHKHWMKAFCNEVAEKVNDILEST